MPNNPNHTSEPKPTKCKTSTKINKKILNSLPSLPKPTKCKTPTKKLIPIFITNKVDVKQTTKIQLFKLI